MSERDKRVWCVWREAAGSVVWAVLSDAKSRHFPVVWTRFNSEATRFTYGEARTIQKRYPSNCGVENVEVNSEGKAHAA